MTHETAIIIGAGPAGLTAAHELAHRTGVHPVVFEATDRMGGISCTVEYKGNRIDIGGHRFFSKSDRIMRWWLDRLPLERTEDDTFSLAYQGRERTLDADAAGLDPETTDRVMLVRERKSRIYWHRRLFDYPLNLNGDTLRKMGLVRAARAGFSYAAAVTPPQREERTLEDFFINRFGRELYETFFKDYTEKVWGVPCTEMPAEWGAQRVKGVSVSALLRHALRSRRPGRDLAQRDTETSLIERFLYPKLGPGQMWDVVADEVREAGGEIRTRHRVEELVVEGDRIAGVKVRDLADGTVSDVRADHVVSTMPLSHLARALGPALPVGARDAAEGLGYRDFFTVGLLTKRLLLTDDDGAPVRDNWIYVQEPGVRIGRLQLFHNWSPYLVADPATMWLGLEYFCRTSDPIWARSDAELIELGAQELHEIGVIDADEVLDGCVVRMPKAYPGYFGTYDDIDGVRGALDRIENLWCVGRNGQHRYNNQDHSMLTAMTAVDHIASGRSSPADKAGVWAVNTEQEYHEAK